MTHEAYRQLGNFDNQSILIVVDHASNHVPHDIDLGIKPDLLSDHIAWDIGVAEIAGRLAANQGYPAILGGVSRLVADFNRYPDEDGVMPPSSDTIEIPKNLCASAASRNERLERFFHPYHDKLASLIDAHSPEFIIALHSFSPHLRSNPGYKRPWDAGVMYNQDNRGAQLALRYLRALPLVVGDQKPYSGEQLNATMNRHAEKRGIPYTGIEIRQDLLADEAGIRRWSDILREMLESIRSNLRE